MTTTQSGKLQINNSVRRIKHFMSCLNVSLFYVSFAACQSGWRPFNGYCYKFVSEKKSWQAAENYCQSIAPANKSANLASVGDDATNMFLSMMTSGVQAWIGGQQDDVGVWSWSDRRDWNFTSWATGRVDT